VRSRSQVALGRVALALAAGLLCALIARFELLLPLDQPAVPLSAWVSALLTAAFVVITVALFTRLSPGGLLLALAMSALLVMLVSWLLLRFVGVWLSPVPVVAALLLAYPCWRWLRLDAALSFIHRQLISLRQENTPHDMKPTQEGLSVSCIWLQSLSLIEAWEMIPLPLDEVLEPGVWVHRGDWSQRGYALDGVATGLRIKWPSAQARDPLLLAKVFPAPSEPNRPLSRGGDLLDIDLAQLDDAYRQARQQRGLVGGALQQLTSGVVLAEPGGEVRLINQTASDLLVSGDNDKWLADLLRSLRLTQAPTLDELMGKLLSKGEPFDVEVRSVIGSRDLLLRGRLVDLDDPLLLLALTDVTELKASERARAEALNFLSHDLRAPLTSVLALIESAREQQNINGELLVEIERYINSNLWYAENYIQLARLQQGDMTPQSDCEALSILDNAVAQIYHSAVQREVKIQLESCDEDLWLQCARSMLERAILNLLDNALKYSTAGDRITLSLEPRGDEVLIRVADQGPGIPATDLGRIFDAFSQGGGAVAGVGLGLRFVAEVARIHGGRVEVSSPPGKGAVFSLFLPRST
jgi:signal transduction histidine kinase